MQEIVENAARYFKQGDFHKARELYQKVAARYGVSIVEVNLSLCDQAINPSRKMTFADNGEEEILYSNSGMISLPAQKISKQLQETQSLLEKYFILSQK
ncbi:hypothetical protein [Cobetia sp. 29-18-1]|uniref:hypothetical protein n=1 Tax=Cobetia sp. 29-18-1 TaxID=3040018 RepID=UPI00244D3CBB|nr:hypothetical protein [Cobetia sp. 29-18-1]MDH2299199.1 hypothetical protein [Cobetia sp. 29-18-1]